MTVSQDTGQRVNALMLKKLFYGQRPLSTIPCGQW